MRLVGLVVSPCLAAVAFWSSFAACIDAPLDVEEPTIARVIVHWDPLACGEPHRVAVELEDVDGNQRSASAPCDAGGLALDTPHLGVYFGRIYAWQAGEAIRSVMPVRLLVDEPVMRWFVATPP